MEPVKRLKQLWASSPGILLGVAIGAGVTMMLVGAIWGQPSGVPAVPFWTSVAAFAGKLGALVVATGVIGAVTRFLSLTGAFQEALKDLLTTDGVLKNRKDLEVLWRRLTRMIYLKDFGGDTPGDTAFLEKVHNSLSRSLSYDKEFFIRDVKHFITVDWLDRENGKIKLENVTEFTIIPLEGEKQVNYESQWIPTSGLMVDDYEFEHVKFLVDGEPAKLEMADKDGRSVARYALSGKKSYNVSRTTLIKWPVYQDPFIFYSSQYVADTTRVDLDCEAEGLKTSFVEIGISKYFDDHLSSGVGASRVGDQRRSCPKVLLPRQGFMIIFQKA